MLGDPRTGWTCSTIYRTILPEAIASAVQLQVKIYLNKSEVCIYLHDNYYFEVGCSFTHRDRTPIQCACYSGNLTTFDKRLSLILAKKKSSLPAVSAVRGLSWNRWEPFSHSWSTLFQVSRISMRFAIRFLLCFPLADIKCPKLDENKLFGKLNDSRFIYPVSVWLSCNHGYWAHPDNLTFTCLPTGQWSPSPEPCQLITCPTPPLVQSASLTFMIDEPAKFLSVIEYVCHWQHEMVKFVDRSFSIKSTSFQSTCSSPKKRSDLAMGEWIPPPAYFACVHVGRSSYAGLFSQIYLSKWLGSTSPEDWVLVKTHGNRKSLNVW